MSKQSNVMKHNWAIALIAILVMALLLIFVNYIASSIYVRQDFTQDKIYTLSQGTRNILRNLESPVTIRFYYSRNAEDVPMFLKNYANRVEDLLDEYEQLAGDKIRLEKLNPEPSTDEEDSAVLDGIEGQQIGPGENFYLGVAFSSVDEKAVLPFLSPADENNLEYNISRALYRVANPQQAVIGVMSSLPVFGEQQNPMMMMQQQQQQQAQKWMFITELEKDYEVVEVPLASEDIPEDIDLLIVHHPKEITDGTQYAIDQFLMRGGRLIAFVDPFCRYDQATNPMNPMMPQMPGLSSLPALFEAWGVDFINEKIVVDEELAYRAPAGMGQPAQVMPTVLRLNTDTVNQDDPVVNTLDRLLMADVGYFTAGELMDGLSQDMLIHSSMQAGLVERLRAMRADRTLLDDLATMDTQLTLAMRVSGSFKSAFPAGRPGSDEVGESSEHLAATETDTAVILVADADMIFDDFWVQRVRMMGQAMAMIQGDNFFFLQNAIEQLTGDPSLISIRSRGITNRPLEELNKFEREAEARWAEEREKFVEEQQEVVDRLNDLQRTKTDASQQMIWSEDQLAELQRLEEKRIEVRKKLRELEKETRRQKDKLKNQITWINIALVPFLLAHFGIILAVFRSRRRTFQRTQQGQENAS